MNRNQEYLALMEELEKNVPDLKGSVKKARNRRFRHRFIFRPAAVLAVSFLLFVAAVNFSPAVAYACSLVPGLRELAAAVSFSRSLSDAVDNDYVQEVNLTQTRNDITVQIPYLIMDQKQVNVFYTIDSDRYGELEAEADVLKEDGTSSTDCGISSGSPFGNDGRLHSFNIEFYEEDVPEKLCFHMDVYTYDAGEAIELPLTDEMTDSLEDAFEISELTNQEGGKEEEASPLAQFDFLLEIDSSLRSNGIILPVNHVLELNEQKITVRHVEVYPTHCRVELEEDPDNTAWLKGLDFSIETRV